MLPKCNLRVSRNANSTVCCIHRPENLQPRWPGPASDAVQARASNLSTSRRSADTSWAALLAPVSAVAVPLDGAALPQHAAAGAEAPQRGAVAVAERRAPEAAVAAAGPVLPSADAAAEAAPRAGSAALAQLAEAELLARSASPR